MLRLLLDETRHLPTSEPRTGCPLCLQVLLLRVHRLCCFIPFPSWLLDFSELDMDSSIQIMTSFSMLLVPAPAPMYSSLAKTVSCSLLGTLLSDVFIHRSMNSEDRELFCSVVDPVIPNCACMCLGDAAFICFGFGFVYVNFCSQYAFITWLINFLSCMKQTRRI